MHIGPSIRCVLEELPISTLLQICIEINDMFGPQALDDLNLADNSLTALPNEDWTSLKRLRICMVYGNQLQAIPPSLMQAPKLKGCALPSPFHSPIASNHSFANAPAMAFLLPRLT